MAEQIQGISCVCKKATIYVSNHYITESPFISHYQLHVNWFVSALSVLRKVKENSRKVAVAVKLGFRKKILKQIRNPDQRAQIVERVVKSHKYGATVVLSRAVMAALKFVSIGGAQRYCY
ncbi:hypothetical protein C5167_014427 [Papaver somniferum]|uniref:Uncharacterized protein n=1 Tax=Papaver somniferum TaxID=3469 RepID=A0A4Y7J7F2_PAPSO|nr:hypothetical protein C5167_014427 [Papaver somniferum]